MLPVNCGSRADYQNFVVTNLCKYYPNPDALAPSFERKSKKAYFRLKSFLPDYKVSKLLRNVQISVKN